MIFGGEDKTLKIFRSIAAKEPILTLYYDSWVTSCTLGGLKLPNKTEPIYGLLIGTHSGILQLIQIVDNKPDIIWQRNVYSEINDIKVGDVTNDGYNEIIVAADDSYIKIYDSLGKRIRFLKIPKDHSKSKKSRLKSLNRAKSLLIKDIDGDNANEIVAGCADGSLRVFHNKENNSKDFELKWTAKFSSSIKDICTLCDEQTKLVHIIFGGYERAIRNLTDFEWGKKPLIKIPQRFRISKIPLKKSLDEVKLKIIPTNLREHITKILENKGFFLTLELLIEKLMKKGYSREEIEEEIEAMKTEKTMRYGKVDVHAWSLTNEEIDDYINEGLEKIDPNNS